MHHVAPHETLPERSTRAPLKHPVRVTIAGERVVRVLSGDISPNGMFLVMPEPPEPGTVVSLAFEARGQVLPFAEGEVAWRRCHARGGFGVRFTRFLHPRAADLVDYLAESVARGTPLKPALPVRRTGRWTGFTALAATAALLVTWGVQPASQPPSEPGLACLGPAQTLPAPGPVTAVSSAQVVAPAPARKERKPRLAETPRATAIAARTVTSAARPGSFSSTAIPSGAARLVNVSRVSGSLRVALDVVAGARVTHVATLQNPARLVMDVSGLPPVSTHVLALTDSELQGVSVAKHATGTRVVVTLARLPTRVVQQGDSALLSF